MPDLHDRFAKLRSVTPPALWGDIEHRAFQPEEEAHGGGRRAGSMLIAAAVALTLVAGSLYLIRDLDQPGTTTGISSSSTGPAAPVDPDKVCDVPAFDPSVSLLDGSETAAYPNKRLDKPGEPAASLLAYGADQLRAFLGTHAAVNAPTDGWRQIQNDLRTVTFAAPNPAAAGEWWLVAFQLDGSTWHRTDFEIVDRTATPAQRGHDLLLRWTGNLELDAGSWNDPLQLVNTGSAPKSYDSGDLAAIPHIFSADGTAVAVGAVVPSGETGSHQLAPGDQTAMPLALTAALGSLAQGDYQVVACLPRFGLASAIGTLTVASTGVVPGVTVMTYPSNGIGMLALAFGKLTSVDGCLAIQDGHRVTYLLMPDGYALVERSGRQVLIGPIGEETAEMGDDVSLGGGYTPPPFNDPHSRVHVPASCASNDAGYFAAGGVRSAT
jgi:hypothetical protein